MSTVNVNVNVNVLYKYNYRRIKNGINFFYLNSLYNKFFLYLCKNAFKIFIVCGDLIFPLVNSPYLLNEIALIIYSIGCNQAFLTS